LSLKTEEKREAIEACRRQIEEMKMKVSKEVGELREEYWAKVRRIKELEQEKRRVMEEYLDIESELPKRMREVKEQLDLLENLTYQLHDEQKHRRKGSVVGDSLTYSPDALVGSKMQEDRLRCRSRSRSLVRADTSMPLTLFVPHHISAEMNDDELINRVVETTDTTIKFVETTHSREFTDSLFIIEGKTFEAKIDAFEALVNKMQGLQSRFRFDLKIGIHNSLVSILIGKGGSQIERIQKQSNTKIMVVDPKTNLSDRIVIIEGNKEDCIVAVKLVYGKLMDSSSEAKLIVKFLVHQYMQDNFNLQFTKHLRTEFNVTFSLKKAYVDGTEELQAVNFTQWLNGSSSDCKRSLAHFLAVLEHSSRLGSDDSKLRMIVPKTIGSHLFSTEDSSKVTTDATPLTASIASSGSRQSSSSSLSSRVQGVSVNVVYSRRDNDEIVLELQGTERAKLEAASLVIEQASLESTVLKQPVVRTEHDGSSMTMNVTVPNSLVARLIGRNGDKVKSINDQCGCHLSFQKPVSCKQAAYELKTPQGQDARMCTIKGTPSSISEGLKVLLDRIIKLEREP
jgi:transcription antitermination factor NusA-like protein